MSNFGGNAGQDWETVNVGRSTKPFKKPTQGDKKQSLTSAQRSGAAVSQQRQFATANKSVGGHGPMGTSAGAGARKLAEETETFKVQKTGLAFGKALMQARMAKKMSQKDLGTKINEKPQVIQQYEQGKAVPNPAIISKLERALVFAGRKRGALRAHAGRKEGSCCACSRSLTRTSTYAQGRSLRAGRIPADP